MKLALCFPIVAMILSSCGSQTLNLSKSQNPATVSGKSASMMNYMRGKEGHAIVTGVDGNLLEGKTYKSVLIDPGNRAIRATSIEQGEMDYLHRVMGIKNRIANINFKAKPKGIYELESLNGQMILRDVTNGENKVIAREPLKDL